MAVVFDTSAPTFRHEMYPAYKGTREKMPDEMREQLPYMKEVTRALRIPLLEKDGYEADDVIGTLARSAESAGLEVMIVTGDKDFMQIVSERVLLYDIMKPGHDLVIVGEDEVRAKFGVAPGGVIDVLALMGDSSDNVPGVSGIGEKTAASLIQEYGSGRIGPRARRGDQAQEGAREPHRGGGDRPTEQTPGHDRTSTYRWIRGTTTSWWRSRIARSSTPCSRSSISIRCAGNSWRMRRHPSRRTTASSKTPVSWPI